MGYLACKEYGVPTDVAKYKIIYVHGFKSGRHNAYVATTLSLEIIEELGVYVVSFDRPELGSKFYVTGYSMGGQAIWSCLKYIPQSLKSEVNARPVGYSCCSLCPLARYWWNTQKVFPASSVLSGSSDALLSQASQQVTQQGVFESIVIL
ncbi:RmlC-like cupins superfamily protein [Hibiscus syriacus]|uniref:RmlC-like cupins superfamily protein n=1 Tax=Hibiscus syriacus TaxID=106335 RepID=A0A6A3BNV9_HIBSY|nr:RmlC-like cupins superfamily protein [Hibiscus syriacus]